MASVGYHESVEELSTATRDMHRAMVSLMEELEAVDWYNQRADTCKNEEVDPAQVSGVCQRTERLFVQRKAYCT